MSNLKNQISLLITLKRCIFATLFPTIMKQLSAIDNQPISSGAMSHDVLALACEPIPCVRIAFIGLGKRGKESIHHFMHMQGVTVAAICDLNEENLHLAQQLMESHGKALPTAYRGADDWREVCRRDDIHLVYVCTNRERHSEIALYAMQQGKHVALEVPAANTVEECWALVNAAETYRRHCMMLENCCYDRFELAVLNMIRQGLLGEVFHVEGAYIHDLRHLDFGHRMSYNRLWQMEGNPYPTHGLGPLCQALGIHRGDRLAWLTSISGGQFNFPSFAHPLPPEAYTLGNINTTIIKTQRNKTIVLQHDISSPRPRVRPLLVSGTEGFVQKGNPHVITLVAEPEATAEELLRRYEHPYYQEIGELARRVGSHGGMDFVMDYRLIYCLQHGLPLDMDVYDAAEWSCIVELSARSVASGSQPVEIPDFTRGRWQ